MRGVSIVIITYNGKQLLPKTLDHIAQLNCPDQLPLELIIVDNNSNDGTAEFSSAYWAGLQCKIPLRVVTESTAGQMYARKRGIKESQYEYILYVDDDNWLDENYLTLGVEVLDSSPKIAACGGHGLPSFDGPEPEWFDLHKGHFGCGEQGQQFGPVNQYYLYTAGLFLRKYLLDTIINSDFKHLMEGRKGRSFVGGEDMELTMMLVLVGYELWYHPDMKFYHFMEKRRLNKEYLANIVKGNITASIMLLPYKAVLQNGEDGGFSSSWSFQFARLVGLLIVKYFRPSKEMNKQVFRLIITTRLQVMWKRRKNYKNDKFHIIETTKKLRKILNPTEFRETI